MGLKQAKQTTNTVMSDLNGNTSSNNQYLNPSSLIVHFEGKTYDIGSYVKVHPGGEEVLQRNRGKDITEVLLNQPAHKPVLNFIRRKLATLETGERK